MLEEAWQALAVCSPLALSRSLRPRSFETAGRATSGRWRGAELVAEGR